MALGAAAGGQLPGSGRSRGSRYKFFRRLVQIQQMDFELALHQMLHLLVAPRRVYRSFYYHKNTKNQWARDDPAFLVLLALFLFVSSVGCALVFGLSFGAFVKLLLWIICIDCIAIGLIIATLLWFLSNRYLKAPAMQQYVDQNVELGYAFDVHCNAFFPLLTILHVLELVLIQAIAGPSFFSTFLADTMWLVALTYYIYITFLGYSALPFLKDTVVFLYPLAIVFVGYVVALMLNWNISMSVFRYYGFHHGSRGGF